jgi:hypothetical protein
MWGGGKMMNVPLAMTNGLKLALLRCALQDLILDRVPTDSADEPKDEHRFGLPDPMCAILCLQIHLRVLICACVKQLKEPTCDIAQPRTQSWS